MIFECMAEKLSDLTNCIIEKNKKAAKNNKLKMFIRNERKMIDKRYYELGKYYYNNLRDSIDEEAEKICKKIDNSKITISNVQDKLREINFADLKVDNDKTSLV